MVDFFPLVCKVVKVMFALDKGQYGAENCKNMGKFHSDHFDIDNMNTGKQNCQC